MLLQSVIHSIESVAPRSAQEQWDNSGMQIGSLGQTITSVLFSTDVTESVLDEAIGLGCQLIISHHPLLFHPLRQLCSQTAQARIAERAIRAGVAIYSAHTSLDSVQGGINTALADMLGLQEASILVPSAPQTGLGAIGSLPEPLPFADFLALLRERLHTTYVRYTEPVKPLVQRIALCGGAGSEFMAEAISQQADVYLTADCKYHEFQDAIGQIALVDIDHWVSEQHAKQIFMSILQPLGLECHISQADQTPIKVMI